MNRGCLLIVMVVVFASLFGMVDDLPFPDALMLALSVAQFLGLLAILDRLDRENPTPGS